MRVRQSILHGVESPALRTQALHCHYVHALHRVKWAQAGVNGAVDDFTFAGRGGGGGIVVGHHHGARAASSLAATQLGSRKTEVCFCLCFCWKKTMMTEVGGGGGGGCGMSNYDVK